MIKITGKVVGVGDLTSSQKPGAPAWLDIKPDRAPRAVRVKTERASRQWIDALEAHKSWIDFTFEGDIL